jgi:hypothetical protein
MRAAGERAGKAAGGWIADGNTSEETLRAILRQWDDGDPVAPSAPSPFSGEWADELTLRDVIDGETDIDPESITPEEEAELADAFEEAYRDAWQEEAERTVRGFLPDGE